MRLTKPQIAGFSLITKPLDDLATLSVLGLPHGGDILNAKKVITTQHTILVVGADNRIYCPRLSRPWIHYRDEPDAAVFSDVLLKHLRAAGVITSAAIRKHRADLKAREAKHRRHRNLRILEEALQAFGLKPTRQQARAIAKLAP